MVLYPIIAGFTFIILCIVVQQGTWGGILYGLPSNRVLYALMSIIGTMLVHQGGDAIARYYNYKVGEDRFNFENESFEQSEELNETEYSVNIPMVYYFNKRMHKGWINIINPFRGTIVLGTPGSGGYFFHLYKADESLLDANDLAALEARMKEIVAEDMPFHRYDVQTEKVPPGPPGPPNPRRPPIGPLAFLRLPKLPNLQVTDSIT